MASPEFELVLDRADRTQKLLWAMLTLSILLYAGVAYLAVPAAPGVGFADTLRTVLFVAAAGVAATSVVMFRRRAALPPPGASAPADAPQNALLRARLEDLPLQERRALAHVARGFPTWIVCLVMNEAIAIFGLVLAFLTGTSAEVVPFAAAAILLNLTMRPDARRRATRALGHIGL